MRSISRTQLLFRPQRPSTPQPRPEFAAGPAGEGGDAAIALLPRRPKPAPAYLPPPRPAALTTAAPRVDPASRTMHLAEYLCSRLPEPPQTDFAYCEVMEEVELLVADQTVRATTSFVGWQKLEVYSKVAHPCDELVRVRLYGVDSPWSTAMVSRCVETVGGWKIDLTFAPDDPTRN